MDTIYNGHVLNVKTKSGWMLKDEKIIPCNTNQMKFSGATSVSKTTCKPRNIVRANRRCFILRVINSTRNPKNLTWMHLIISKSKSIVLKKKEQIINLD